ncbi:hypothetical protein SAMN03159341_102452 [Paenibacillus sp. 1_12]|uniref:hypothetical protein n=1 Tax=Paenibacillus sp. 1_12 TaxID=1566278 RepID=UPI0008DFD982|nr:hypothetical protein [Paenibacillus sp. 1_12]SFK96987.1 hypothetical protein SAMN03159341_102452 [Paenibacillus sp. 1_12]
MKLFQVKSNPWGIDRMALFLKDNFISISCPGIGDLEHLSAPEQQLVLACETPDSNVTDQLNEISCFVQMMQDGDYVLVAHDQEVYLGDVGDYYYVEQHDSIKEGMCHRRGVTWLNRIPRSELNKEVQALLNHREAISPYEQAIGTAGLDRWLPNHLRMAENTNANVPVQRISVDEDTLEQALGVLKEALCCDDPERRERAAIAILQYAGGQNGSGQ